MIAGLPMYDWEEVRLATDALWARMRDALRSRGIDAPDALSRGRELYAEWRDPELILGQTCGLPFRADLKGDVQMVGAIDYGLPDCPPGYYCSALTVAVDDPRSDVAEFAGAPFAYNSRNSQSGYTCLMKAFDEAGMEPGAPVKTGAHAASIRAIAEGRAEIAAIDGISHRLAVAYMPEVTKTRVIGMTPPTPGQALITAPGNPAAEIREAMCEVLSDLPEDIAGPLGIIGFADLHAEDYLAADAF